VKGKIRVHFQSNPEAPFVFQMTEERSPLARRKLTNRVRRARQY
jgi:hypothetical protein